MSNETSGLKWELELERAAHQETQAHLQRALGAAVRWKVEADGLRERADAQPPNPLLATCAATDPATDPAPNPGGGGGGAAVGGGGGGDDVVELVLEAIGALAQLGDRILTEQVTPGHPRAGHLMDTVRHRVDLLGAALLPAEGAGVVRRGTATQQGGPGA